MENKKELKNSTWRVIIWSLLDSGNNAPFIFMMFYFLVYNDFSFGIAGGIVGVMMAISRAFDGVTDPIIGLYIDKLHTKWGKFRPSLLIGLVLLNTTIVGMFWGPNIASMAGKIIYVGLLYIVHIIGYTFVTATWKTGNTVITRDPKQRSMQGLYMTIGTMVVAIGVTAGVPVFMQGDYTNAMGWRTLGMIIAAVNVFFGILAIFAISNRDTDEHYVIQKETPKFKDFLPVLKENKPLSMLIVAASTNKLASTTMSAVTVYWYIAIMGDALLQSKMSIITMPIGIIAVFFATWLAVKKSKKFTMLFGSWASIFALILLVVVRPFDPSQFIIYVVLFGLVNAFNGIANAQVNVMIADTADYELWKTGKAIPAMISTTFSFIDKMVSSASGLLVGAVIGLFHYTQGDVPTEGFKWAIIGLFVGVPLLGHVASIWALKRYDLDREMNQQIAADLQARVA